MADQSPRPPSAGKILVDLVLTDSLVTPRYHAEVKTTTAALRDEILQHQHSEYDSSLFVPRPVRRLEIRRGLKSYDAFLRPSSIQAAESSGLVRAIRMSGGKEGDVLTHEHIIVDLLNKSGNTVMMVGPYGSGKSHRLAYIWEKYLYPHEPCREKSPCGNNLRVNVLWDFNSKKARTPQELYLLLLEEIRSSADSLSDKEEYRQFVALREDRRKTGPRRVPYWSTLDKLGIVENRKEMPTLRELQARLDSQSTQSGKTQQHYADLLLFALDFLTWIRERKYTEQICITVFFDNIDSASPEVQEELLEVAKSCPEKLSVLCAVREETLLSWVESRVGGLNLVPHVGASAYDVVMARLSAYLSRPEHKDLEGLDSDRANLIKNLSLLFKNLQRGHFRRLFNQFFAHQVRSALVFAENIIDLADAWPHETLKGYIEEYSDYALERLLYAPFGLGEPVREVGNAFSVANTPGEKLIMIAALRFLARKIPNRDPFWTVGEVHSHLSLLFKCDTRTTIQVLKFLLLHRFIVAKVRERHKLADKYEECKNESIRITEVGEGLSTKFVEFGYIQVMMFHSLCDETNYKDIRIGTFPTLGETLTVLRPFLKELAGIETLALARISRLKKDKFTKYLRECGEETVAYKLYESILNSLCQIVGARRRRGASMSKDVTDAIGYLASDYVTLGNTLLQLGLQPGQNDRLVARAEAIASSANHKTRHKRRHPQGGTDT